MTRLVINFVADRDAGRFLEALRKSAGSRIATSFDRAFDALFVRLMQFPESGAKRFKLGAGIRIGVVRPFVVSYRYDRANDMVEVLRILDGRRDIDPEMLRV